MRKKCLLIMILAIAVGLSGTACKKTSTSYTGLLALLLGGNKASTNSINSYSINGVAGAVDSGSGTITVNLPCDVSKNGLVAVFTHNGARIRVGTVDQVSGVTSNDFTSSVTYRVDAGNGDTKNYAVTVNVAANSSKAITAFSINGVAGTINEGSHTIIVTLPCTTTSVTSLPPAIAITGASVTPASGVAKDFTSPVTYTVMDCNASTQDYTVTVNVAAITGKDITAFSINGRPGIICGDHIHVVLPIGTAMSNLVATFATTGNAVSVGSTAQTSGVTANDFTNPVTYTVTDCNISSKNYIVEVYAFTDDGIIYDDNPTPNTVTGRGQMIFKNAAAYKATLVTSQSNPQIPLFESYALWMMTFPDIYKMSTGAGADGLWFTDDDTSKSMIIRQYVDATHKRLVMCSDYAGTISGYYYFTFDSTGRIISYTKYTGSTDAIWFNGNDQEATSGASTYQIIWNTSTDAAGTSYEDDHSTKVNIYASTRNTTTKLDVLSIFDASGLTLQQSVTNDYSHALNGAIINQSGTEVLCQKSYLDGSNRIIWTKLYQATANVPDGDWWDGDEVFGAGPFAGLMMPYTINTYNSSGYRNLSASYSDEAGTVLENHTAYTFY